MSKRRSLPSQKPASRLVSRSHQVDGWLDEAGQALVERDYHHALEISKKALRYLPQQAPDRVDFYNMIGNAYAMLQQFEDSYQALSKALSITPDDPYIWYNRASACLFTFRTAQAQRDLERAVELEGDGKLAKKFAQELPKMRKIVQSELKLRGRHFTIDQLIEQQEWFQRGLQASGKQRWEEAAQAYRNSIDMGDCLPQPQGNLGMCLIMLNRLDEAEQALRRALEIDPKYKIARSNLTILEEARKTGVLPVFGGIQSPFEGQKIKQSITFVSDKKSKR